MSSRVLAIVLVCGAIDMLANALYLVAARPGPLSVVVTLSSLYRRRAGGAARVVLGERFNAGRSPASAVRWPPSRSS